MSMIEDIDPTQSTFLLCIPLLMPQYSFYLTFHSRIGTLLSDCIVL